MVRGSPSCVSLANQLTSMTSFPKIKRKFVWFVLVAEKAKLVRLSLGSIKATLVSCLLLQYRIESSNHLTVSLKLVPGRDYTLKSVSLLVLMESPKSHL